MYSRGGGDLPGVFDGPAAAGIAERILCLAEAPRVEPEPGGPAVDAGDSGDS
jgi:hypothetical protein